MRHAIALVPLACWASAASADFRPAEDHRYRYETVETRTADGVARRFRASRTILFHRTAEGYDATLTLDAIDRQAEDEIGRMFTAGTGALLHYPLRYRLDRTGAVLGVEDPDAAIARIATAMERMTTTRARAGSSRALASPLRALPTDRKVAMLSSILTAVLAGPVIDRPPGARSVTVPSRPPLPPGVALGGTETVSRGANGVITVETRARGGLEPAAAAGTPGAGIARPAVGRSATIRLIRNLDPATGLLRDSHDISDAAVSEDDAVHTMRIDTVITLTLGDP